jgi:hypothetical protein
MQLLLVFHIHSSACWFMLVSCLAYSSTLNMKVTCSCETLLDFLQSYALEDRKKKRNSMV